MGARLSRAVGRRRGAFAAAGYDSGDSGGYCGRSGSRGNFRRSQRGRWRAQDGSNPAPTAAAVLRETPGPRAPVRSTAPDQRCPAGRWRLGYQEGRGPGCRCCYFDPAAEPLGALLPLAKQVPAASPSAATPVVAGGQEPVLTRPVGDRDDDTERSRRITAASRSVRSDCGESRDEQRRHDKRDGAK